ncbi:MAG: CHAT domain-containing protein, partial [bacterium]|nr:CHAT domain-containing protein [bacterium]
SPGSLLLIGDPEPVDRNFPRLAHAAKEIETIRRQLAGYRQQIVTGAEATPRAYHDSSPGSYSVIHFAAHAIADYGSPLLSSVVLSPGNGTYKLYAQEIGRNQLQADLVTISACRSAGARAYSGEGLVGFAWAFLHAGARNVVAGLWDVADSSTTLLMEEFYRELAGGASPAAALRKAKLELVHSSRAFRKPYYWGPFQLYTSRARPAAGPRP